MYPYNLDTNDHDFDNFKWPRAVLGWWGEAMAQEAKNHAGKIGWVGVGLVLTPVWNGARHIYSNLTKVETLSTKPNIIEQCEKINENTVVSNCNSFINNNKLEIEQIVKTTAKTTVNQTIKKLEKDGKLVSIYSPKKQQLLYSRLQQLQKYYPSKNLINIAIPRSKRQHFKMLHLVTKNEQMKQQVNSSTIPLVTKNEQMKQQVSSSTIPLVIKNEPMKQQVSSSNLRFRTINELPKTNKFLAFRQPIPKNQLRLSYLKVPTLRFRTINQLPTYNKYQPIPKRQLTLAMKKSCCITMNNPKLFTSIPTSNNITPESTTLGLVAVTCGVAFILIKVWVKTRPNRKSERSLQLAKRRQSNLQQIFIQFSCDSTLIILVSISYILNVSTAKGIGYKLVIIVITGIMGALKLVWVRLIVMNFLLTLIKIQRYLFTGTKIEFYRLAPWIKGIIFPISYLLKKSEEETKSSRIYLLRCISSSGFLYLLYCLRLLVFNNSLPKVSAFDINLAHLITLNRTIVHWVNIAVSHIIETDLSTKQLISLIKPFAAEAASTYVFFVQITYYFYTALIQISMYLVGYSIIMKLCHRTYDLMEN